MSATRLVIDPNRLREIRLARALSHQALARRSGVARMTISRLEAGTRNARPSTIRSLAQALDVAPLDIARYDEAVPA